MASSQPTNVLQAIQHGALQWMAQQQEHPLLKRLHSTQRLVASQLEATQRNLRGCARQFQPFRCGIDQPAVGCPCALVPASRTNYVGVNHRPPPPRRRPANAPPRSVTFLPRHVPLAAIIPGDSIVEQVTSAGLLNFLNL